jgi:hypothetical protein
MLLHDCNLLSDEGKWRSVKLMVASARCEEVESGLTAVALGAGGSKQGGREESR